jgi:type IV secretory pathway VirB4 component
LTASTPTPPWSSPATSGSGKTATLNILAARFLSQGARGFAIDRAGHFRTLTELVPGSAHIDLGADHKPATINPWDVDDPADVPREKIAFLIALHGAMLGDEFSAVEHSQLGTAIRAVYLRAAEQALAPRESMLRDELRRRAEAERHSQAPELAAVLRNLAEALGEFSGDGAYAYLVDRETTVPDDPPLLVFDTRHVSESVLGAAMFAITEFCTRSIEHHRDRHRDQVGRAGAPAMLGRAFLVGDEFWHVLQRQDTGQYANDLARRARHLGLFLLVSSQQPSDFDTDQGRALLDNATQVLLLMQRSHELPFISEAFGLSEEETAMVGRLKTVKGSGAQAFWINGDRGRGQVVIRIGPLEYWASTSDPLRDVPLREQALSEHDGDMWAAIHHLARSEPPGARAAA